MRPFWPLGPRLRTVKKSEDNFPPTADQAKLNRRYKAILEEYYTKTGLHPVTPQNFPAWFAKAKGRGICWHAWEICSGSGRLSLIFLLAGLIIGHYGWDIGDPDHQRMLLQAQREFQPGYVHCSSDCAPWSQAGNTKDPKERQEERMQARPSLEFTKNIFNNQAPHHRGYGTTLGQRYVASRNHQPSGYGSDPWQQEEAEGRSMHAWRCGRAGQPNSESNRTWRKCEMEPYCHSMQWSWRKRTCTPPRCRTWRYQSHCGCCTAAAAMYPRGMCQKMKPDIVHFLQQRGLMQIPTWPKDLIYHTISHYYECIRCQLGRACPPDIKHTMIPKQCRSIWKMGSRNCRLQV